MAFPVDDLYTVDSGAGIYTGNIPLPVVAHVFIESGQSNCQGLAPRAGAPAGSDPGPIAGCKTWRRNQDGDMYSGAGAWQDLDYEWNQYQGRNQFGSILKFGLSMSAVLNDANNDLYFIKADGNGKPIAGWLNGGNEAVAMYAGHITPALADLASNSAYDEIRIHGFFWDQGESDSGLLSLANAYSADLTTFISDVRAAVGISNLPFFIRRLDSAVLTPGFTHVDKVIAAQVAAAASDPDVYTLDGPYTYLPDNLHIDAAGQNLIGDDRHAASIAATTSGFLYNV